MGSRQDVLRIPHFHLLSSPGLNAHTRVAYPGFLLKSLFQYRGEEERGGGGLRTSFTGGWHRHNGRGRNDAAHVVRRERAARLVRPSVLRADVR